MFHVSTVHTGLRRLCALQIVASCLALVSAVESSASVPLIGNMKPVAELLTGDGRLNLTTGYSGAVNLAGFRVETGGGGAPRFVSDSSATMSEVPSLNSFTGDPDSHWDDRFPGPPGVSGNVSSLAVIGSDICLGGSFTTAGGEAANYIVMWDGASWSPLGSGVNSTVRALAVIGTDLYAAGNFTIAGGSAASRIAKWNGTSWSALGTGMDQGIYALAVVGTDLYAGGNFTTAGGVSANRIAKWNGASWSALGAGTNNSYVSSLAV